MTMIPGPNNEMITASIAPAYGSTVNYVQVNSKGTSGATITPSDTFPYAVISGSISTNGNPVQITCYGDVDPLNTGGWGEYQLYRNSTPIGTIVRFEAGSTFSKNSPFGIIYIDDVPSGVYTYYLKVNTLYSHSFRFGKVDTPTFSLLELGRV